MGKYEILRNEPNLRLSFKRALKDTGNSTSLRLQQTQHGAR